MDNKQKKSAQALLLHQYLEQFKEGVKTEDDYLQFSSINKYIKKAGIDSLPTEIQARYARLLRERGTTKRSIELLENIYRNSHHQCGWDIRWELLCDYFYENDYDKAEAVIADWFYVNAENKNKPMYQTIVDGYKHRNLVLACMGLAKEKKHTRLKTNDKIMSYYEQQIDFYQLDRAKAYNKCNFQQTRDNSQFDAKWTVDGIFDLAKELLPTATKSTNSYLVDFYYFDFDEPIGKDMHNNPLTGIKVTTLKNSQDILLVIPYDVKNDKKFRVINPAKLETKENDHKEEKAPIKSKRMSQIEKFNRRYQNN